MLRLVVKYRRETLVFPLPEAEVTLGSSSKADLVVPFSGVSRLHARVAPAPGGIRIADAGSKNGVVSGGERVVGANVLPLGALAARRVDVRVVAATSLHTFTNPGPSSSSST